MNYFKDGFVLIEVEEDPNDELFRADYDAYGEDNLTSYLQVAEFFIDKLDKQDTLLETLTEWYIKTLEEKEFDHLTEKTESIFKQIVNSQIMFYSYNSMLLKTISTGAGHWKDVSPKGRIGEC